MIRYSSIPLPLLQQADIEIQQNSIEAEIAAEINLPPQPAYHRMLEEHQLVEGITLNAEIVIVARTPVKVTVLRQTNRPFSIPVQKIDLQLNPQATTMLKYF